MAFEEAEGDATAADVATGIWAFSELVAAVGATRDEVGTDGPPSPGPAAAVVSGTEAGVEV